MAKTSGKTPQGQTQVLNVDVLIISTGFISLGQDEARGKERFDCEAKSTGLERKDQYLKYSKIEIGMLEDNGIGELLYFKALLEDHEMAFSNMQTTLFNKVFPLAASWQLGLCYSLDQVRMCLCFAIFYGFKSG